MRWIIGDIHGMLRPLARLIDAVCRADSRPRFYFVGDYVNRGPDSRGIIDLLLALNHAQFIRGNHDDIFDQIINDICYAPNASEGSRPLAFQWFTQHGLDKTLVSYGADPDEVIWLAEKPSLARLLAMLTCIPEAHRAFIRNLPPVIEEDDLFIAHGHWDVHEQTESPCLELRLAEDRRRRYSLLWERYELAEITEKKAWRRIGYFGHTPVENYPELLPDGSLTPIIADKMVLVDTACAVSRLGRLTAYCHEERRWIQVDRSGQVMPER